MSDTIDKYREYVITGFVKAVQPIVIERAQGAVVTDEAGKEYIDCFAGIAVVNAGHCNPEVTAAAMSQMQKLVHWPLNLTTTQPMADLAEKMAQIAPVASRRAFRQPRGGIHRRRAQGGEVYTGRPRSYRSPTASTAGRGVRSRPGNAGRKRRGGPYAPGVASRRPLTSPSGLTARRAWRAVLRPWKRSSSIPLG